jgi:hypothetical protein
MKKRTYRKIAVKEVDVAALAAELGTAVRCSRSTWPRSIWWWRQSWPATVGSYGRFAGRIRAKTAWF